ncbi:MAG TPA: porin [Kofleriaceae bacterium]|nr:porin [Kofleriaceae bacterium]
MRTPLRLFLLLLPIVTAAPEARAEKITVDDDTFFNIGVLIQPQFTATEDASPDGDWGTDFFLRRGRLLLTGQFDPHISFIFVTDQANFGKNGDFTTQFIVQDAVAAYKVGPAFQISAGFMLLPFIRNGFTSASQLSTIDYRAGVIKFPATGRAFRDMGVEVRGLVAQDRVYYRAGVFSGINGSVTDTGDEINPGDVPRLTGTVRFNILGKDEGYAPPALSFGTTPLCSVGVALDWQKDAFGDTDSSRYLAMAADIFVDFPMPGDQEFTAQAAIIRYDSYAQAGVVDEANAFFVEGGYRFMQFEPVFAVEWFNGDAPGTGLTTYRAGLNYFITKHTYNLKAELAIPDPEELEDGTDPPSNMVATVQAQVSF